MEIQDIEAFLAIADTRNLSKAADLLFVTQSTISYRLKRLESEINVQLIDRNRGARTVTLTPKGELFTNIALQWIALWKESLQISEQTNHINLRIGQVDWFISYPFEQFYLKLLNMKPNLKLDIKTSHSIPISELVNNDLIDIGFVVHPIMSNQIVYQPVFRDPLVLVCSKRMQLSNRKITPSELDPHYEVFWKYYGEVKIWHDQWWDSNIIPTIQIDFSVPTSFRFLENPKLWLVSPKSIAEHVVKENTDFAIYEFSSPPPDLICYCIRKKMPSRLATSAINLFTDFLDQNSDIFITQKYMEV